ncbi:T-cell surface glycoprotein CD3 delta chain-like [Tachysurus vachellii]|uniref:T-cell surface glycoprotein CD3 delta chain-like n=1 Tax=Tachysurus vachellii TaxID=175792 RepID=UPI00296AC151|nr:T-cell surface glycoprotein CD3 delta chain-like [Tachysurus vachellii]XP_060744675.1 T-cell surface glycoprotein CD3 delta chain-like [Tachysurus vachellii]
MKMKWRSLFCLLTCLLMQNLVSGDGVKGVFSVDKKADQFFFICELGNWQHLNESKISLSYKDRESGDYYCGPEASYITVTVKFRTCETCIELDAPSLSIVIVGNILATFFVAYAVYSITGQPKNKSFSGNKASDKVTLLNGEQDTYQQLNPGQSAEYSRLKGGRRA